jgi:4-diphosphocytidyl-2C-methyl-D-erythritol kinase
LSKRAGQLRRLEVQASAKVNLALEVLGKRPDGYHEIVTVMQAVDLCDRLTLEPAPTLTLEADDAALPTDERNLVIRAAMLLRQDAAVDSGARIRLRKRIPVAAGLGGGSSDAAATLWGLNRLWGLRWPRARLTDLAGTRRLMEALKTRNPSRVAAALTNNLEGFVAPTLPAVDRMKAALLAAGALGAVMSGSGPTVFGMARSLDHARQIRRRVNRADWACWAVRTHSGPAIRAIRASG